MVSIIIPIYNAEHTLRRCLDSIHAQTYTDWECILVDDGSNDSSGSICDEYAENDSHFQVYHKENGGVSSARNCGLDNARGEWIGWVDSDDYVEPDFLQNFIELPQDVDLLQQGFHSSRWYGHRETTDVFTGERISRQKEDVLDFAVTLVENCQFPFLWCKLFRSEIISKHSIRFNESLSIQEDYLFIAEYFAKISSFANSAKCSLFYDFPEFTQKYKKRNHLYVYKTAYSLLHELPAADDERKKLQSIFSKRILSGVMMEKDNMTPSYCKENIDWWHKNIPDTIFREAMNKPFWSLLKIAYGKWKAVDCMALYVTVHIVSKFTSIYMKVRYGKNQ